MPNVFHNSTLFLVTLYVHIVHCAEFVMIFRKSNCVLTVGVWAPNLVVCEALQVMEMWF